MATGKVIITRFAGITFSVYQLVKGFCPEECKGAESAENSLIMAAGVFLPNMGESSVLISRFCGCCQCSNQGDPLVPRFIEIIAGLLNFFEEP